MSQEYEDPKHPLQGWLGADCKWYDKGCTHFPLSEEIPSYCTYYKGNPCRSYFPKDLKCPECSSTFIGKTMEFDFFCYKCMTIIKVNSEEIDVWKQEYLDLVDSNGLGEDKE